MKIELLEALRADLDAAGYSASRVTSLWGATAEAARHRGVIVPARRALADRETEPLTVLASVFLLGEAVGAESLSAALPNLGSAGALELGLVASRGSGSFGAALSLNPVSLPDTSSRELGGEIEWWILSDLDDHLRQGPAKPEHVMGVGGATRSLLAQAPLGPDAAQCYHSALDLGTGCGIVAMCLAHSGIPRVVATDISERALMLANANTVLNGLSGRIEFRSGSLFEPVAGEKFDLILSNPPFVVTPRGDDGDEEDELYQYRDGGMTGDELAATVVRESVAHLTDRGTQLCLANWESRWGQDGLERVGEWIEHASERAGAVVDAWVIERDRVDPVQYAETWARDGGARPGSPEFDSLIASWIGDFASRKVLSVGLGSIRVRRAGGSQQGERENIVRLEQSIGMFAPEGPGVALSEAFDAGVLASRMSDDAVLDTRWHTHPRVGEEREYRPGAEEPRAIHHIIDIPIGQRVPAGTLIAAALGVCDGELSLRQIADALASVLDIDAMAAAAELLEQVRELAWFGMVSAEPR